MVSATLYQLGMQIINMALEVLILQTLQRPPFGWYFCTDFLSTLIILGLIKTMFNDITQPRQKKKHLAVFGCAYIGICLYPSFSLSLARRCTHTFNNILS